MRGSSVVAFLAVAALIVNLVCFGPMYTNVSGALNASKFNLSAETVSASKTAIEKVGEEAWS